jgi:hypothetical protein
VKIKTSALALLSLVFAASAFAQTAEAPKPNDYSADASWLCRPGKKDACAVDLNTTIVKADGSFAREDWKGDPNAPIDCFYVYPPSRLTPTPFSDMNADPAELNVVRQQFARFGSACRQYAPLYRQVTLAGLRTAIAGGGGGAALSNGPQYDDVRDAWRYYLEHDNRGRGVVLIGHSQGSFILTELIRRENRWQADPVPSGLGDSARGHALGTARQGRRRLVPASAALSKAIASELPRHLCVVQGDITAARQHTVRQSHRARHGRRVYESGGARRWQRSVARVSRRQRAIDRQCDSRASVGRSGTPDRHALGQRAWSVDGAVHVQRARVVPRDHGTR